MPIGIGCCQSMDSEAFRAVTPSGSTPFKGSDLWRLKGWIVTINGLPEG
jgi:hypothetical protein